MRLKLVLLTSLLGAVISVALSIAIVTFWLHSTLAAVMRTALNWPFVSIAYVPAIASAIFTAFFVYRHTAHRRKLQATLTAVLTIAFWLIALVAAYFIRR